MPSNVTLTCSNVRFDDEIQGLTSEIWTVPMLLDNATACAMTLSYRLWGLDSPYHQLS